MNESTKGWFDCLNAIAIEMEADKSFNVQTSIINVMDGAGISIEEVCWAQEQEYVGLDNSNVLTAYEGILMEREENEEEL